MMHLSFKDKRKLGKPKKGTPQKKSLYHPDNQLTIQTYINWYLCKFKPYSAHLFTSVLTALVYEKSIDAAGEDAIGGDIINRTIETNAQKVKYDMEAIHEALKALEVKKHKKPSLYITGNDLSIFDFILFNEMSQILFLYNHFKEQTKADFFKLRADEDEMANETSEILDYTHINKWYKTAIWGDKEIKTPLDKIDKMLREGLAEKIKSKMTK